MRLFESNVKKEQNNGLVKLKTTVLSIVSAIKPLYVVSVALFIGACYSGYLFYTQSTDIDEKRALAQSLEDEVSSAQATFKKKNEEVKKFNELLAKIDKNFLPIRAEFGVYKFILEMDELKKKYPFDYKIDDNEKKLTNIYRFYSLTFIIDYENIDKFKEVMRVLTKDYYMGFISGDYENGKFVMKYDIYAYSTNPKG